MDTDELIDSYLRRAPTANTAYYHDATYHLHLKLLSRLFCTLDQALDDEGVPEETRLRALRSALYATIEEPQEAADRMRLHAEKIARTEYPRQDQPVHSSMLHKISDAFGS